MKKRGSTSDFTRQRDRELYTSFMEVLRTDEDTPLREMFALAAARPASRFWVSERRAADVIGAMLRGANPETVEKMYPQRRAMYEEILRRVRAKMEADPSLCMTHAVDTTVCEPAPSFYLTDESARCIIYRIRRRARAARLLASKRRG